MNSNLNQQLQLIKIMKTTTEKTIELLKEYREALLKSIENNSVDLWNVNNLDTLIYKVFTEHLSHEKEDLKAMLRIGESNPGIDAEDVFYTRYGWK